MKTNQSVVPRLVAALAGLGVGALAFFPNFNAKAQIQWIDADVGAPMPAGSATVNANGSLTITGGGSDIWNTSSQFNYYYAWAYGTNWSLSAQLVAFSGPDDWSKVELMVDWADPVAGPQGGDPFISMIDTQPSSVNAPDGSGYGVALGGIAQFRTMPNGQADSKLAGAIPAPNYPNDWFKISRTNSVFTLAKSPDGVTWATYLTIDTSQSNLIGDPNGTSFGVPWPNLVAVGIAVTAHNQGYNPSATATIANLRATFPPATPPTRVATSQDLPASVTGWYGCEGSLTYAATNNAFPVPAVTPVNYQWYRNGTSIANATASTHTWLLDTSDDGAIYHCAATLAAPYHSLTCGSAITRIVVQPGVYYTNGLKLEMFSGAASAAAVEQGNAPAANWFAPIPNLDQPGNLGNYYATRVSGWFIAPTTDTYHFYDASDDQSDLFLSTDSTMGHKVLIAQETGWNGLDQWLAGGANNLSQQCSDTFVNPSTLAQPYPTGIPLIAGQPYFIEQDHYQGAGGDNFAATYQTSTMEANPNWANTFTNGAPSLLTAANGNIMFVTKPVTTLTWVAQPHNLIGTVGLPVTFYAQAASDSQFPIKYTWYRGNLGAGTAVATAASYSTPPHHGRGQWRELLCRRNHRGE